MKLHVPSALGEHTVDVEAEVRDFRRATREGEFVVLGVTLMRNGRERALPIAAASAYLDENLPGWADKVVEDLLS